MTKLAVGRDVPKGRRPVRAFASGNAKRVLEEAGFGPGREVFGFNGGLFSSIDLLAALLDWTGPASAVIATWTAAGADLGHVERFVATGRLTGCRWIVDRSFQNRQPELCRLLRDSFGDAAIRVAPCHAKFMLLASDDWRVVVQTSMNLNLNRRVENFWAADDPALFAAYAELVDDVFRLQGDGLGFVEDRATYAVTDGLIAEERARSGFFDVKSGKAIL